MNTLRRFAADENGATAIEFALITAGLTAATYILVGAVVAKVNTTFAPVLSALGSN